MKKRNIPLIGRAINIVLVLCFLYCYFILSPDKLCRDYFISQLLELILLTLLSSWYSLILSLLIASPPKNIFLYYKSYPPQLLALQSLGYKIYSQLITPNKELDCNNSVSVLIHLEQFSLVSFDPQ